MQSFSSRRTDDEQPQEVEPPVQPTAAESALASSIGQDCQLRCPFYCEENVWRLAYRKLHNPQQTAIEGDQTTYFVVIVSNERKSVPMFYQRASESQERPCVWDYHVFLIGRTTKNSSSSNNNNNNQQAWVYDIDTTLTPYPLPLQVYLRHSFSEKLSTTTYAPLFRVVPATLFLRHFESDRSHMYNAHTGTWSAPPPPYQCILPAASVSSSNSTSTSAQTTTTTATRSNLKQYLNFSSHHVDDCGLPADALGTVLTLQQLETFEFT